MAASEPKQPCQVYLAAPPEVSEETLAALLDSGQVAALFLYGEDAALETAARRWAALAHAHGVPLILDDAPELARAAGADGVHIPANEERYGVCRNVLGSDAIVGAGCGTSRHDALALAEQGADYVAFGPEPGERQGQDTEGIAELVSWWQEVCEPPVVAWHDGGWADAEALVAAGADFIGVSALIREADDPIAALSRLNGMMAELSNGGERNDV